MRWLRVAKRLDLGRTVDALADVEHLEALAHGKALKHSIWMKAGELWRAAGMAAGAGDLFERALRYVPDDPIALGGLGAALVEASQPGDGRDRRGIALLSRALGVLERLGSPSDAIRLDLARCLAERLGDYPTAIAHVSRVAQASDEAAMARGLEGRWRRSLGELAGASLAFERLREHAESRAPMLEDDARGRAVTGLLVEGAELFERTFHDVRGAARFLEVALHLRPKNPALIERTRELGERVLSSGTPSTPAPPDAPTELDVADASARVEDLTQRLRADPSHDAHADELASLLERLGRSHELVALLFARIEDASLEKRTRWVARARETLERLARDAEQGARVDEVSLFRGALAALS